MTAWRWLTHWPGGAVLVWFATFLLFVGCTVWHQRQARRALRQLENDVAQRVADTRRRIRQGARLR